MRDSNRLYKFYNELMKVHIEKFPDWRVGQFINNLERWLKTRKGIDDLFYIEEIPMMNFINEFVEDMYSK